MTEAEESERRQKETRERTELFKEALDVDDVIAHLLVAEGYAAVEDVADSAIEDLQASRASTRTSPPSCSAAPANSSSGATPSSRPALEELGIERGGARRSRGSPWRCWWRWARRA